MSARQPLADIEFIRDFAAFCRTKGDETYNPGLINACALAQFGYPEVIGATADVPRAAYQVAIGCDDEYRDIPGTVYTFSALADRLEALIADAPVVERAR